MAPNKSTKGSSAKTKQEARALLNDLGKMARNKKDLDAVTKMKLKLDRMGEKRSVSFAPFSGLSEVSAAPVTIGNTVRSVKQTVYPTQNGVRVVGRDYVQAVGGQLSTFTDWCLQGGLSLSPMALNASGLRGFFQTYEQYRWNRVCAHYITSSPTSLTGDVLMVYHRNHGGPKVNHRSANFLSYALSTDAALIGPQWTNHSIEILKGTGKLLGTDVLDAEDVQHQADGELLVYAKNTTNGTVADQPGYLLLDYDVTFVGRMLNPRVQTLPAGSFKWFPTAISFSGLVTVADSVFVDTNSTNTYTGTAGTVPAGVSVGDVFQIVLDLQRATFGGTLSSGSEATMWSTNYGFTGTGATSAPLLAPYAVTTGTTIYAVYRGSANNAFTLYPSYPSVFAGNDLRWSASSVGLAFTTAAIICCVGSIGTSYLQANIG